MKSYNHIISLMSFLQLLSAGNGFEETYARETNRVRVSNRHYNRGDWVTYTTTRFVRHLTPGPNHIYYATTGGITRYNHFSDTWDDPFTVSDGLASNDIYLVAYDLSSGYLWCTAEKSISYMEPASRLWYNFYFDEMQLDVNEMVHSLGFSDDRRIFLVTARNRWLASSNTSGQFYFVSPPGPSTKIQWFGSMAAVEPLPPFLNLPYGLMYDQQNRTITDNHLRYFKITCWARDNWNKLWLGTWGLGAGRADLFTTRMDLLPFGLWNPLVYTIAADPHGFWIAGVQDHQQRAGITYWVGLDAEPIYYEPFVISGFHDERITQIAVDGQIIWFATQNGLTRFDRDNNRWRTFSQHDHLVDDRIEDIIVDGRTLWVATQAGLSAVGNAASAKKDSLSFDIIDYKNLANVRIYDLDLSAEVLWAACEFGLYFYDTLKKVGGFYTGAMGPGTQRTYAVSCFADEVWFATDQGVSAFLMDEAAMAEWPMYALRNYPIDGRIRRIHADSSAVWVGSERGVYLLDRRSSRWLNYSIEDGLPATDVYCMLPDGDYIWFGSSAGLTRFYWNDPLRID